MFAKIQYIGIVGLPVAVALFPLLIAGLLLAAGCTQQAATPPVVTPQQPGMPNPASVSCEKAGGALEIKKDATGGEYGMCTFANGTSCEEWALFRGEGCTSGPLAGKPVSPAGKMSKVAL